MQKKSVGRTVGRSIFIFTLLFAFLAGVAGPVVQAKASKTSESSKGSFKVVGIGPGDPDLLTPRAIEAIQQADVVFCKKERTEILSPYVDFRGKEVLDGYRVLFRFYDKKCANLSKSEQTKHRMTCDEYHQKQAEFAGRVRQAVAEGKQVVLLSSGDPTIYGPDMWALQELHDLDPVVVPGVSSFNAANAAMKASLGEVIITAPFKKKGGKDTIEDLSSHEKATMVIFMPRDMDDLFTRLSRVYAAETPAAIVSYAGHTGREKVTIGTVGSFATNLDGIEKKMSIVYVGKALAKAQYRAADNRVQQEKGKFYLVGMGPGDPDLATMRALKVIEKADLIFARKRISNKLGSNLKGKKVIDGYHRLFPFYGKDCAKVTGDEKPSKGMSCEEYHRRQAEFAAMTRAAVAEGKIVAMLDDGDPLVYGPCSWSLMELRDLDTEVVPGLSCFNAANAALRVGVTEGKESHSVLLASGWTVDEMAVHQSTMVLFTMRTDFKKFVDKLSKHYLPETPVAIVFNAGYADRESVMHGTLGSILAQVGNKKLPFEYLLYVGDFLLDSVDRLNTMSQ